MLKSLVAVALAALLAGCSSGPSAAVRDKRVCAAFETFWDTDYNGPPSSVEMFAARQNLTDAIKHGHDKRLGAAAQAVMGGVLGTPRIESRAELKQFVSSKQYNALRAAVEPNEAFVESRCDQLGRHING